MADPEQINVDQLAFWNGSGGHTWVARQEHTDITLAPVTKVPPRTALGDRFFLALSLLLAGRGLSRRFNGLRGGRRP